MLEKQRAERKRKLVYRRLFQHEQIHLEDPAMHHRWSMMPLPASVVSPGESMNQVKTLNLSHIKCEVKMKSA